MAWLDFIKSIRRNDEDEQKRASQGGFRGWLGDAANAVDNTIDAGSDLFHGDTKNAARQFRDSLHSTGEAAKPVRDFAINTLQSIPQGVGNTFLTVREAAEDKGTADQQDRLRSLLDLSEGERKKIADADPKDDARATTFKLIRDKSLNGDLSDDAIKKRLDDLEKDKQGHLSYKPTNTFTKALFGADGIQSAQQTQQSATKTLEDMGASQGTATKLGTGAALVGATLDLPTGATNIVKGVGKQGIKAIAAEGGEDAVRAIIKGKLPKISDIALNELVPRLAKATDEKKVKEILVGAGKDAVNLFADPIANAKSKLRNLPLVGDKLITNEAGDAIKTATKDAKQAAKDAKIAAKTATENGDDAINSLRNTLDGTPTIDSPRDVSTRPQATDLLPQPNTVMDAADESPSFNATLEQPIARPNADETSGFGIKRPESLPTKPAPTPSPNAPKGYGEATDELLGRFKYGSEAQEKKPGGVLQNVKEQFFDKLSPLNDFVKTVESKTGRKLATEENPYQQARLMNGMPDRVVQRVQGITDVLKQADDINDVKALGIARQILNRSKDVTDADGNVIRKGISSTISPERAQQVIDETRSRLGDQKFSDAASIVDSVNDYSKGLLDDAHKEGLLSDDALKAIEDTTGGDYFTRMNVLHHIFSDDKNRALFSSGGSYNTTKQSINKFLAGATGHEEGTELLDPIESLVRSTDSTMRAISKNQIWRSFDRLADEAPDLVKRVRDPEDALQRMSLADDNADLRPIRDGLDKLIKSRATSIRRLQTQARQLGREADKVSTKGAQKQALGLDAVDAKDTKKFMTDLLQGSVSKINRLRKMVGNRDSKVTSLLDEVLDLKGQYDDVAEKVKSNSAQIRDLADKDVPEGFALISGFGKGQQGKLAVPKEVADVYTGKNKAQQDYLTSTMATVNNFVKQNFTSNNPVFALVTNPIRDAKSFAYNAKDVGADPFSIGTALVGGLASRLKRDDSYKRWIEAGGKSGFYADERTGERIAKDVARKVNGVQIHSAKDFIEEAGRIVTTPFRLLHNAASIAEDAPRLAQFKASLKSGKSDAEAAFNARNVTVDFQQSGRIGQTINAWVPFLNARLQGSVKSVEAIKRNPARAAAVYAGLTAAPIALAALNNQRFPDVMKMIPDSDRQNNFVIVIDDHQDESGKYDHVVEIPKSDVDKVLGNPLDNFMRYLADDDPKSVEEMVTNMIGQALPFDTVKDDEFNTSRAIGSVLPPLVKAPIESATNHNFYYDSQVVPDSLSALPDSEQVREDDPNTPEKEASTSGTAKFLANLAGTSPIKTENTLRNVTGSLLTEKPQDQLGGALTGASATKMNTEFYKTLKDTSRNRASASKHINEAIAAGDYAEAQKTAQAYNAYLQQTFTPFGKTYGSMMTQELADMYDKQKIVLTTRSIKQRQRNQLERQAAA